MDLHQLAQAAIDELGDHPWVVHDAAPWVVLESAGPLPGQGWKLHLSAHQHSVGALIDAALPVLAAHRVHAKVVRDEPALVALNEGLFGVSQVGKIITVYPAAVEDAVVLAAELDRVTRDVDGPEVPFDIRLRAGSSVFYRYGAFRTRLVYSPYGGSRPAIRDGAGRDVPDDRTRPVPSWVDDPFVAAGVSHPLPRAVVLGDRYALLGVAHRSARGLIHPAIDLVAMEACTAKRARAWSTVDSQGRDARDRLRHEAEVLERLRDVAPVPRVRDLVHDGDDLVLVLDEVTGMPLDAFVASARLAGALDARRVAHNLLRAIAQVHEVGIVIRDLKPGNVLVTDDGGVHLIDFEIAYGLDDVEPPFERGTPGFGAPSQLHGSAAPAPTDDIFGLGSLLWLLVTERHPGAEPGLASLTLERAIVAKPDADPQLVDLMLRCLDREPARRPPSVSAMLAAFPSATSSRPGNVARPPATDIVRDGLRRSRDTLIDDLDDLVAMGDTCPLDIASGLAGLVLAACTVGELMGDEPSLAAAERGASRLADSTVDALPVPGLFVGIAGVAVALVHPAVVNDARRRVAINLIESAKVLAAPSFDVINGTAGIARGAQLVGVASDAECAVLERRARLEPDDACWRLPESFTSEPGTSCIGYAHGAAGVADVLCDQYAIDGNPRWIAAAELVMQPVTAAANRYPDGTIAWSNVLGGGPAPPVWCRGAGGTGVALAKLGDLDLTTACWAAVAAARTTGASRCHGLSGQVELLLDAGRVDEAGVLCRLLVAYAPPSGSAQGRRAWLPAGLLEGNAGLAVALARMLHPSDVPWLAQVFGTYRKPTLAS